MEKEIVVITGGDGNIAKATIRKFLKEEYQVIAIDCKESTNSLDFVSNPAYQYYQADITKLEELHSVYDKIESRFGKITHLISAAGCPIGSEIDGIFDVDFLDIERSVSLNLTSHIYITKIFLPLLLKETKTNRSITLISSINAIRCFNLPIYSATKSGIYGFVKSLTKELGGKGIRINAVSPGTVPTPEDLEGDSNFYNYRYKQMLALENFTTPEDIAYTLYSITHIMRAVTGQNIVVDSGQTA